MKDRFSMSGQTAEQKILSLTIEEYESVQPIASFNHDGREIVFHTPNRKTLWRAQTLLSKEPETIEWIVGFRPVDVLVDVGANVGMYSIWAAATRQARVFAFEPEAHNYALLNRNIVTNCLTDRVTAYCAALLDESRFDLLHLSASEIGGSCHSFGEELDFRLQPARFRYTQGCFSVSLDELVERKVVSVPQHIKIDVDGLEHKVLEGAQATLRNPALKSLLVEINTNVSQHMSLVELMQENGFEYSEEQVEKCKVKEGPFRGVSNFIFSRQVKAPHLNRQQIPILRA